METGTSPGAGGEERLKSRQVPPTIFYLPYARLDEPVSVGKVCFRPLSQALPQVEDKELSRQVVEALSINYDTFLADERAPIDQMAVACAPDPIHYPEEEYIPEWLARACSILAFCCICRMTIRPYAKLERPAFPPPWVTADNFDPVGQRLGGEGGWATLSGGSLFPVKSMWKVDELRIVRPVFVNTQHVGLEYDEGLLQALVTCEKFARGQRSQKRPGTHERVMRAIQVFHLAYRNIDRFDPGLRVVLLAYGFETLWPLGSPKKGALMHKIQTYLGSPDDKPTETVWLEKMEFRATLLQKWAYDFYELRSDIVHGDFVDEQRYIYADDWHQLHLGATLLAHAIKASLAAAPRVKYDYRDSLHFAKDGVWVEWCLGS